MVFWATGQHPYLTEAGSRASPSQIGIDGARYCNRCPRGSLFRAIGRRIFHHSSTDAWTPGRPSRRLAKVL